MANLSAAKDVEWKDPKIRSYAMAAEKIWKGALVCLNASGYAANAADTAGFIFIGVAKETKDNSGGQAGDLSISVRRTGEIACVSASADVTFLGKAACVVDNQTVGLAATPDNDIAIGKIVAVESATKVRVKLEAN